MMALSANVAPSSIGSPGMPRSSSETSSRLAGSSSWRSSASLCGERVATRTRASTGEPRRQGRCASERRGLELEELAQAIVGQLQESFGRAIEGLALGRALQLHVGAGSVPTTLKSTSACESSE